MKIDTETGVLTQCPKCKRVFLDEYTCPDCKITTDEICDVVTEAY